MVKKVNVRKDYSYQAKKSLPKYAPGAPRKTLYLILRGPGLDATQIIEENEDIKAFALKNHIKLKFIQAKDEEAIIAAIKDANVWAAGIVLNLGSLNDESGKVQTVIKKILIDTEEVRNDASYLDALQTLLNANKQ